MADFHAYLLDFLSDYKPYKDGRKISDAIVLIDIE